VRKRRTLVVAALALVLALLTAVPGMAQPGPSTMRFQGRLLDDGGYQMGFTLGQGTHQRGSAGGDYQVVQGYWALAGFCFWMDIDCNCTVNVEDVQAVADRWRCEVGDGCYDDRYDVDGDGIVTVIDGMQIAVRWGWTCP
jgi:hypothetical protein